MSQELLGTTGIGSPTKRPPTTEAFAGFFRAFVDLLSFVGFVPAMAMEGDKLAKKAQDAGIMTDDDAWLSWTGEMASYHPLVEHMIHCHAVDNFLTYVSDLISLAYRTRPEMLKSTESVKLDEILEYTTMEDLVSYLVDRKVNELTYQGMRRIDSYLSGRFSFRLFEKEATSKNAVRIVEARNVIVHNRGFVSHIFISRVPDCALKIGQRLEITWKTLFEDLTFLSTSASDIDARAIQKFNLRAAPFDEEFAHRIGLRLGRTLELARKNNVEVKVG